MVKHKRFSDSFPYCTDWGFTSEMPMYEYIWRESPHVSWLTGRPIHNPKPKNFAHVLPKRLNGYPHYRLNPDNVLIVHEDEHDLIDVGTEEKRKAYSILFPNCAWDEFYALEAKLKAEYRSRFDDKSKSVK